FPTAARFPSSSVRPLRALLSARVSPTISWANVPAGTQSFFLHMHDLDLPTTRLLTLRRTGPLEHSGYRDGLARRRTQGIAIARRKLSDQRHQTDVPRSRSRGERSVAPLRV